jgi:hypothetical protein
MNLYLWFSISPVTQLYLNSYDFLKEKLQYRIKPIGTIDTKI